MMRIHVRMGTVMLPDRQLNDTEVTHDIVDVIDVGENETAMQCELERTTSSLPPAVGGSSLLKGTGFHNSERQRLWRYRLVTIETTEAVDPGAEADEITDVSVAGELNP